MGNEREQDEKRAPTADEIARMEAFAMRAAARDRSVGFEPAGNFQTEFAGVGPVSEERLEAALRAMREAHQRSFESSPPVVLPTTMGDLTVRGVFSEDDREDG
jgi:hypothetical protein